MRLLCCDVDGTVIDSQPLVRRAYAEVGVLQPDEAWGLRWQDWLTDYLDGDGERALEVHRRKTDAYTDLLIRSDLKQYELPAAHVARFWLRTHGARSVCYLTAGTRSTAHSAITRLGIGGTVIGGVTYADRLAYLLDTPHGTVYLDDRADTIEQLKRDTTHLTLVNVSGLSHAQIVREIGGLM